MYARFFLEIKEYKCVHCGNLYSRYPSLWKHTKKCTFNPKLGKPDLDRETSTSFEIGDEEITGLFISMCTYLIINKDTYCIKYIH